VTNKCERCNGDMAVVKSTAYRRICDSCLIDWYNSDALKMCLASPNNTGDELLCKIINMWINREID
jgi:hypothetical protein